MSPLRIGNGFDVHPFSDMRPLILGGVKIDHPRGLLGHSDADVLVHSIIDSLLGPAGIGDIGRLFPDNDNRYKNISSIVLLKEVYNILKSRNIRVINTDSVVICEKPKIAPYIEEMKKIISSAFDNDVPPGDIGIKGTTSEKLGFTGRGEGIAVYTVSLIQLP
jgi:2-C-methyl-D-erythritol 2,4-cyclodiphosphate synthase